MERGADMGCSGFDPANAGRALMAEDLIRYDILAQEALRGVVRKVLSEVAKTGLPGDHHFFISFMTRAPGVRISEKLLSQYDKEMTIVIQNQYWDLKVTETGFEIGLSFDGQPELLVIPLSSVKGFFDPSVQFGLQFDPTGVKADEEDEDDGDDREGAANGDKPEAPEKPGEKVVSLDSFRKKP
jgi:hypothetical protein